MTIKVCNLLVAQFFVGKYWGERHFGVIKFGGERHFVAIKFGGERHFVAIKFGGERHFRVIKFGGERHFWMIKFGGERHFVAIKFGGERHFGVIKFGGERHFPQLLKIPRKILQLSTLCIRNLLYICKIKTKKGETNMARPIAPTPVLTGKDAERFAKHLENPAPISKERKDAARKAYEAFKAIATFPL